MNLIEGNKNSPEISVAVIPARGGSKRIPRKNIKQFCGQPMIKYSIDEALRSEVFDNIVVSSDDIEILDYADKLPHVTPLVRPENLSDDFTPTVPVIQHAIEELSALGRNLHSVCCIYATAPFIKAEALTQASALIDAGEAGYCFPICEYSSPIQRAIEIGSTGATRPMFAEFELVRTQDLPKAYFDAGQFYFARRSTWMTNKNMHVGGKGIPIPHSNAVDIDTVDDWEFAERLFQTFLPK